MTATDKNILCSYADGAAYSLMVGFGETYFAAYALAIGLSEVTSGLVATLPLVAGGVLQLAAPRGARFFGSLRRWVVTCALVQASLYIPLAIAAWYGRVSTFTLFLLAALYWGSGLAAGPAWNNWIDATVPPNRLRDFLAHRSRLTQLAALLAFLAGGWILSAWEATGRVLAGFMVLMALAGLCRLISAACLRAQGDAPPPDKAAAERRPSSLAAQRTLPLREVLQRFQTKDAGRFLLFLLVSQVSVNIAGPFFSPYMLAHVGFSYGEYVALVAGCYLAKIVFYPYVARFVRRVGAYRALWISGLAIAPPPLFWFWTPDLYALITLQVAAGVAWAVFELSSTLLFFDHIRAEERICVLTYYNLFNAAAVGAGSLVGGAVLASLPPTQAYHWIFAVSAVGRLLSLSSLFGMRQMQVKFRNLAFRVVTLRPSQGSFVFPILAGHARRPHLRRPASAHLSRSVLRTIGLDHGRPTVIHQMRRPHSAKPENQSDDIQPATRLEEHTLEAKP